MTKLNAREESFIAMMAKSEEHARKGFALLAERSDPERFFPAILKAGLLDRSQNPAPVPSKEEGYFHVPTWSALDYLERVARISDKNSDQELAGKVMDVIRSVSEFQEVDDSRRDNYRTYWKFA